MSLENDKGHDLKFALDFAGIIFFSFLGLAKNIAMLINLFLHICGFS